MFLVLLLTDANRLSVVHIQLVRKLFAQLFRRLDQHIVERVIRVRCRNKDLAIVTMDGWINMAFLGLILRVFGPFLCLAAINEYPRTIYGG